MITNKIIVDGEEILVSVMDYEFAVSKSLRVLKGSHNSNLITYIENGITHYLHKEIARRAGLDVSNTIDHVSCDYRNNQRDNLRPATKSQQQFNQKTPINNTSGYKGVSFCKQTKRWAARIHVNDHPTHLGRFDTPEQAALAYDNAARNRFKEFARLNFPREGEQQA